MLLYNLVSDYDFNKSLTDSISNAKNWNEINKILKKNKISSNFLPKILSTAFFLRDVPDPIPYSLAFSLMREFKNKHRTFNEDRVDGAKELYIKLEKLIKKNITDKISELRKIKNTSQGWVTIKFGCNQHFKNFDIIVGFAYQLNGDITWFYSNPTQNELKKINDYDKYNDSLIPPAIPKTQGIAFKVFPIVNQTDINNSLETWLSGFGDNDKIYIYPGYSNYTTLVLSNDDSLDTKIDSIQPRVLNEIAFDQGQACCPPRLLNN